MVEQPVGFGVGGGLGNMQQLTLAEAGRAAVAEIGRLVSKFGEGGAGRLWLLGTATCETYLRCQVYHPTMENDWDLQAVPITSRAPLPGIFPRYLVMHIILFITQGLSSNFIPFFCYFSLGKILFISLVILLQDQIKLLKLKIMELA